VDARSTRVARGQGGGALPTAPLPPAHRRSRGRRRRNATLLPRGPSWHAVARSRPCRPVPPTESPVGQPDGGRIAATPRPSRVSPGPARGPTALAGDARALAKGRSVCVSPPPRIALHSLPLLPYNFFPTFSPPTPVCGRYLLSSNVGSSTEGPPPSKHCSSGAEKSDSSPTGTTSRSPREKARTCSCTSS